MKLHKRYDIFLIKNIHLLFCMCGCFVPIPSKSRVEVSDKCALAALSFSVPWQFLAAVQCFLC